MGIRTHRMAWAGNLFSRSEGNSNFAYLTIAAAVAVGGIGGFQALGESTGKLITEQVHSDATAAAGVDDMPMNGNPNVTLGGSFAAAEGEPDPALCQELHLDGAGCDAYLSGEGIDCDHTQEGYRSQCIGFLAGGGSVMGDPNVENENFDPDEYAELLERIDDLEDDSCSGFGCFGKGLGDIGSSIASGVSTAWNVSTDWVADTATSVASAVSGAASSAASWVASTATSAWNSTVDGVTSAWNATTGALRNAWDTTFEWGRSAVNWTKDAGIWLGNGAWNVTRAVGGAIGGAIALTGYGIYKGAEWVVTSTWDAIKATPSFLNKLPVYMLGGEDSPLYGLVDNLTPGTDLRFSDIYSPEDGLLGHIGDGASWVGGKTVDAGRTVASAADTAWDASYEWTTNAASTAAGAVAGAATTAAGAVANAATTTAGAVADTATTTAGAVADGATATAGAVADGATATWNWTGDRIEDGRQIAENVAEGVAEGVDTATDNRRTADNIRSAVGDSVSAEILELAHRYPGNDKAGSERMADIREAARDWAANMSDSELEEAIEGLQDLADSTSYSQTADFADLMANELNRTLNPPEPVQYQGGGYLR